MFASVGTWELEGMEENLRETFALMPERAQNDLVIAPAGENDMESRLVVRSRIDKLEQALYNIIAAGAVNFKDIEDDGFLTHRFIEGVYARELVIPAGTAVIGKLHKYPRICIISGGDCTFVTEFGTRRVSAPFTEVMPPGSKTAVYAHTDTTWTAIHGTDERDLDRLEQIFIAPDHSEYQKFLAQGGE